MIDSNIDDDVMTDDELVQGAINMLDDELAEAVTQFVNNPAHLWIVNLTEKLSI